MSAVRMALAICLTTCFSFAGFAQDRKGDELDHGQREKSLTAAARPDALGSQIKFALASQILSQIKPYWDPPQGPEAEKLRTSVLVSLARDGTIIGEPVVTQTGVTEANHAIAEVARECAVRAVRHAAPYRLPGEYYDAWKTIKPTLYEGL